MTLTAMSPLSVLFLLCVGGAVQNGSSTNGTPSTRWDASTNGTNQSTNGAQSTNGTLTTNTVQNNGTQKGNQSSDGKQSLNATQRGNVLPPELGTCDFDLDTCIWRNEDGDDFDWTRHQGPTPSSTTGPSSDHSGKGHYMYIETSNPRKRGELARLVGGPFLGTKCMRFFYCMFGTSVSDLQVFQRKNDSSTDNFLWGKYTNQGKDWHSANLTVQGTSYKVVFVGRRGKNYQSDIAIDDITFESGPCPDADLSDKGSFGHDQEPELVGEPGTCHFDLGFCDWINMPIGDQFEWVRHTGPTFTKDTGPQADHSGRDKYYIFAESSSPQAAGHTALLLSPRLCGQMCMQFFYHMHGDGIGSLSLYKREGFKTDDLVWSQVGPQRNNWTEALVDLGGACYQLVLEAVIGQTYRGDIAVDDVLIRKGSCCNLRMRSFDSGEVGNCTFDDGLCYWRNSVRDDFNWILNHAETTSVGTGPAAGYNGTGQYIFIESSEPRHTGDKAMLVSANLKGLLCMRFKYHIYGQTAGSLRIHVDGNGLIRTLLWEKTGDQGNVWHGGQVTLPCQSAQYHVEIVAEVAGWKSDIALDNVEFFPGECPPLIPQTVPNTTLAPITLPLFDGNCTFPDDLCQWGNDLNDDSDWILHSGNTFSHKTGPHSDADGNGVYLYLEASNAVFGKTARLISGYLTGAHCLKFWFHMLGEGMGSLTVEKKETGSKAWNTKWKKEKNQGNSWQEGSVSVSGRRYQIAFLGTRGTTYEGDISIDTVSLAPGSCDGSADGMPSDLCTFNSGFCDWQNEATADKFDWTLTSGHTRSRHTGPDSGHGGYGQYAYIEASAPRRPGDNAILKTSSSGENCFYFYYHMYGKGIGSLNVYQQLEGEKPNLIWSRKGPRGNLWRKARVPISAADSYWVLIEGVRVKSFAGDIGIDDVGFVPGGCSTKARTQRDTHPD